MTADAPAPVTAPVPCVQRTESQAYVAAVKERAYVRWTVSSEEPDGSVVIAFRLDEHGQLLSAEVRTSTSESLGQSAREALAAGAPYPEMPPEARCLARLKLIARFETPVVSEAEPIPRPPPASHRPRIPFGLIGAAVVFAASFLMRRARGKRAPEDPQPSGAADPAFSAPQVPGLGERSHTRVFAILAVTLVAAALFYLFASGTLP